MKCLSCGLVAFSDVSQVLDASRQHGLMMKAARSSETSVNFYQTKRSKIPKDSYLHTSHRENLKFHQASKRSSLKEKLYPRNNLLRYRPGISGVILPNAS
jgi:hypothetical protein